MKMAKEGPWAVRRGLPLQNQGGYPWQNPG